VGQKHASQIIALKSGQYRILTPKELTRLGVKAEGRIVVDRFNNPAPLNTLDITRWKHAQDKYSEVVRLSIGCLIPLALSGVVLVWGRSPFGARLGVVIPLLTATVVSSALSVFLLKLIFESIDRIPAFALFLPISVGSAFCWPFAGLKELLWIGFAGGGLMLLSWLVLILKMRPGETGIKRLNNRNPGNAIMSFYRLLLAEEDLREEAVQYLVPFRESKCIGCGPNGYSQWQLTAPNGLQNNTDKARDLPTLARNLVDRTVAARIHEPFTATSYGGGSYDYVFLRPLRSETSSEQIVAYTVVTHSRSKEQWTSPLPDWDVKVGTTVETEKRYDHKIFTKFDDGWFLESGKYAPPPSGEIEALRKAELLS
jgi:hypothetical protein